jgi:hypothetical protein
MKERHYQRYLARKRQREKSGAMIWQMAQAANGPIHECLVPGNLFELGIGNLAFSRRLPDGNITLAMFLLDVFCLGVKNAFFVTVAKGEYDQRMRGWPPPERPQPMPPACFRKLVEGGVAYARELGFNPHVDYDVARQIFGNVEASTCPTQFEYGHAGKPLYCSGPNETPSEAWAIVEQLKRRLGEGNFEFLIGLEELPSE